MAAIAFVFFLYGQADASIGVGSMIKFYNGPGGSGGEFGIGLSPGVNNSLNVNSVEQVVFCVEKDEFLNFSSEYYVESIATYASLGGANTNLNDPLDARTAWLYYNFRQGTLANYTYGALNVSNQARIDSANALQNAFWFLENEQNSAGNAAATAYVASANAALANYNSNSSWGNMQAAIDRTRIINIRKDNASGAYSQSQLFLVPEPTTALTWTVLVGGFAALARRRNVRMG